MFVVSMCRCLCVCISVQQRNDYYVKCVAQIGQFKLTVMTAIYINTSKDTEADRHLKNV